MQRNPSRGAHGPSAAFAAGPSPWLGLIGTIALTLGLAAPLAAQFSVQPVIVHLAAEDTTAEAVLTVANEGEETLQLDFYLGDFDQRDDGSHVFAERGTAPHSCGGRLSVFPNGAVLEPDEVRRLRVRMAPGSGTCWSMAFVESTPEASGRLRIGQRIGVKVYGVAPGARSAGQIDRVSAVSGRAPATVDVVFRNTGEAPLRPHGRLEIRTPAGSAVATSAIDAFSALPGHRRRLRVNFPGDLSPGRYVAVAILDFGGDYLAGGQTVFEAD